MKKTAEELLDLIRIRSQEPEPDPETLYFQTHPLKALWSKVKLMTNGSWDYHHVFNDLDAEFGGQRKILRVTDRDIDQDRDELIQNTIAFFTHKLIRRRLSGEELSPWEKSLAVFLEQTGPQYSCTDIDVKKFIKLPVFYLEEQAVKQLTDRYKTVKPDQHIMCESVALKLVGKVPDSRKNTRNKFRFFFVDGKGRLFVWRPERDDHTEAFTEYLFSDFRELNLTAMSDRDGLFCINGLLTLS